MKTWLPILFMAIALTGCGGSTPVENNPTAASGENAGTAAAPTPGGTLSERTFGDLVCKFSAPKAAGNGFAGLQVDLTKTDGTPVSGAQITGTSSMPEHQMDGPDLKSQEEAPGKYWLPGGEMMKGKWMIDFNVKDASGKTYRDTTEFVL